MIPQEYIQEVVRRNDIEEIIGQYVQLRRRGRTATGLCLFHKMSYGDNRHIAFFSQSVHDAHDFVSPGRVEHRGGLVQYKHARFYRKHAGNGNTLFLSAGQFERLAFTVFFHAHAFQGIIHTFAYFLAF